MGFIEKALETDWSDEFVMRMQNRMVVSYAKYGPIRDAFPKKINAIESLQKRLDKYLETGNTEWLVDAANFALIEYLCPSHPNAHFRATDSDESIGRTHKLTGCTTFESNEDQAVKKLKEKQQREGD